MCLLFDHYKHKLGIHGSSPVVIQEDEQEPSGSGDGKKKGKIWGDFRKMKRDAILKGTRKSSKSEFDRYLEEEEDDEVVTRALVGSEEDEYNGISKCICSFSSSKCSSRAGPSGSSPATHVLVSSPTMSQVEEDYVDNNSNENDETYVDVEPDEE
ncbi:unnamed protein product [Linum trigynum]|uniref:Uncharacterized protein n=1 Tax=Linum trigynum TaxID=586398 RepID=A0AAV2CX91_9ROSI